MYTWNLWLYGRWIFQYNCLKNSYHRRVKKKLEKFVFALNCVPYFSIGYFSTQLYYILVEYKTDTKRENFKLMVFSVIKQTKWNFHLYTFYIKIKKKVVKFYRNLMYKLTWVPSLICGGSEDLRHSWVAFRIFWRKTGGSAAQLHL